MSLRRLVLVRHGESVWNVEHRVQGQTCRGLTAHGHVQAERTSELLASWLGEAAVVSSDLGRCVDTAAPIAAAFGVTSVTDAALRERSFGRWEGLDRAGLEADDADRYARWRAGEDVIAEVGGESDAVLRERSSRAFAALLDAVQEGPDTVVAVTHGGTIWYGVHELLRITGYRLGAVHNASVTELVLGGRGPAGLDPALPHLARFNETAHLR
jgi:glucosyl-3-phosphoglycerate phosphatase